MLINDKHGPVLARRDIGWRRDLDGQLAVRCDGHLGFNRSHVAAFNVKEVIASLVLLRESTKATKQEKQRTRVVGRAQGPPLSRPVTIFPLVRVDTPVSAPLSEMRKAM
jgi:hypothetical protein